MYTNLSVINELLTLSLSTYAFSKERHCFYDTLMSSSDSMKMRDIVTIVDKLNEIGLLYTIDQRWEITIAPRS